MIPSTYENHFVILLHILKIKVVLCLQIIIIYSPEWMILLPVQKPQNKGQCFLAHDVYGGKQAERP